MKALRFILIISLYTGTGIVYASAQVDTCWVRWHDASSHFWPEQDIGTAVRLDASGCSYVVGHTWNYGNSFDFQIVKYDKLGNLLWEVLYGSPGIPNSHPDIPAGLELTQTGEIVVTGRGVSDILTVKYNLLGNFMWAVRYNGDAGGFDSAVDLEIDAEGNIYVVGNSIGIGTLDDIVLIKYNGDGEELWTARYDGPISSNEDVSGLVVDKDGNSYVVGSSFGDGTYSDYVTLKYDPDGNLVWANRYDGPVHFVDLGRAIALDKNGDVYVTGSSWHDSSFIVVTIKYDTDGNVLWVRHLGEQRTSSSLPHFIQIDESGSIYIAATSVTTDADFVTLKYDTDGNLLWVRRYNGPTGGDDYVTALTLDTYDAVYVTGQSQGTQSKEFATVKYDSRGNLDWIHRYNGWPPTLDDGPSDIIVDNETNVYICGTFGRNNQDFALLKLRQIHGIELDILPGECPNQIDLATVRPISFPRPLSAGIQRSVTVAIVSDKHLTDSDFDTSSFTLLGLRPTSIVAKDVSSPRIFFETPCECDNDGADGFTDLVLTFDRDVLLEALEPVESGEQRSLMLNGQMKDGRFISGSDCLTIITENALGLAASAHATQSLKMRNYPNPFNAATVISYDLATAGHVTLVVFDILGRRVATLVDDFQSGGSHEIAWDATDEVGNALASGMYFYRLSVNGVSHVRKMTLLR